jgi:hypothetical protein
MAQEIGKQDQQLGAAGQATDTPLVGGKASADVPKDVDVVLRQHARDIAKPISPDHCRVHACPFLLHELN